MKSLQSVKLFSNFFIFSILLNNVFVLSQQISNKNLLLDISDSDWSSLPEKIKNIQKRSPEKDEPNQFPSTCDKFNVILEQPVWTEDSIVKKCCPFGQKYNDDLVCTEQINDLFRPSVIEAKFFDSCIEDLEKNITLKIEVSGKCDRGVIYNSNEGDIIYVIQNGSLLIIDPNYEFYDIYNDYCLELSGNNDTIAVVCDSMRSSLMNVSKFQAYITAVCMLLSVPCLLITAFFHLAIKKLRNLHGETLACHSICLAIGFFLLSIVQFTGNSTTYLGYFIQYFILACFLWLMVMCIDITLHVWYYLPKNRDIEASKLFRFIIYFVISMTIPLIFVLVTHAEGLPGMPSYYLKGMTEATKLSQQYFIPPICVILFINICLFVAIYFGFRQLNAINSLSFLLRKKLSPQNTELSNGMVFMNSTAMEEVKRTAKSTLWLFTIMAINWIFEIISFYVQGLDEVLILFDVLNALQGILIFIIFVCLPHYSKIIKQWWIDRGTLHVELTEIETLNK